MDLSGVEHRIAELKAQIEPTMKEIRALEGLANSLRILEKGGLLTAENSDLDPDSSMPRAAEQILRERPGQFLHFREITELAIKKGFRGKRTSPDAPIERLADSFRRMMAQEPEIFEREVRGLFRLRES